MYGLAYLVMPVGTGQLEHPLFTRCKISTDGEDQLPQEKPQVESEVSFVCEQQAAYSEKLLMLLAWQWLSTLKNSLIVKAGKETVSQNKGVGN